MALSLAQRLLPTVQARVRDHPGQDIRTFIGMLLGASKDTLDDVPGQPGGGDINTATQYWVQLGYPKPGTWQYEQYKDPLSPDGGQAGNGGDPQSTPRTPADIIADLEAARIDRVAALGQLAAFYISQGLGRQKAQDAANQHLNASGFPVQPAGKNPLFREQQGFADVARRFSRRSGVPDIFRDFTEDTAAKMQLPFLLAAATGQLPGNFQNTPFHQRVDDPQAFESFLNERLSSEELEGAGMKGQFFDPRISGNTLREVAAFLRIPGIKGEKDTDRMSRLAGQETLRASLQGPSGSVGSELFAPTIAQATQPTGRRLFPALGEKARSSTQYAINTMLAENPEKFPDLPSLIEWLVSSGVI